MAFKPLRDRSKSARSVVRYRPLTYFDHSRIHFGLGNFIILNERTSALLQAAQRAQKTRVAHLRSIASWGYVTLTIDLFGPRGIGNICGKPYLRDLEFDAYRGLNFLVRQPFVDAKRIVAMGFSQGCA